MYCWISFLLSTVMSETPLSKQSCVDLVKRFYWSLMNIWIQLPWITNSPLILALMYNHRCHKNNRTDPHWVFDEGLYEVVAHK